MWGREWQKIGSHELLLETTKISGTQGHTGTWAYLSPPPMRQVVNELQATWLSHINKLKQKLHMCSQQHHLASYTDFQSLMPTASLPLSKSCCISLVTNPNPESQRKKNCGSSLAKKWHKTSMLSKKGINTENVNLKHEQKKTWSSWHPPRSSKPWTVQLWVNTLSLW